MQDCLICTLPQIHCWTHNQKRMNIKNQKVEIRKEEKGENVTLEQGILDHFLAHPKSTAYFALDGSVALGPSQRHVLKAVDRGGDYICMSCEKVRGDKNPVIEFVQLIHDGADVLVTYNCDSSRFQRVIKNLHSKYGGESGVDSNIDCYKFSIQNSSDKFTIWTDDTTHGTLFFEHASPTVARKVRRENYFDPSQGSTVEAIDFAAMIENLKDTPEWLGLISTLSQEYKNAMQKLQGQFFQDIPRKIVRGLITIPFEITPECKMQGIILRRCNDMYSFDGKQEEKLEEPSKERVRERIRALQEEMRTGKKVPQKPLFSTSPDPALDEYLFGNPDADLDYSVVCTPKKPHSINLNVPKDELERGKLEEFLKLVGVKE